VTSTLTASAPSLSGVSPSSYPANNTNQTMLVNGSNFQSGATLTFQDPQGDVYTNKPTTFDSGPLFGQWQAVYLGDGRKFVAGVRAETVKARKRLSDTELVEQKRQDVGPQTWES
jgi:hypothetical protein